MSLDRRLDRLEQRPPWQADARALVDYLARKFDVAFEDAWEEYERAAALPAADLRRQYEALPTAERMEYETAVRRWREGAI